MTFRELIESKTGFLIYDIPKINKDYKKMNNKSVRKLDLKSKEYKEFYDLLVYLDNKWSESDIIEFLYASVNFIYWDDKRKDYNYLNNKDINDNFFKSLTKVKFKNYKKYIK